MAKTCSSVRVGTIALTNPSCIMFRNPMERETFQEAIAAQ